MAIFSFPNPASLMFPTSGGGGGITWSTPVDANIVPDANGTRNIGSSASGFLIGHIQYFFTSSNTASIDTNNKFLYDNAGNYSLSWGDSQLRVNNNGNLFNWSSLSAGNPGDVLVNSDGNGTVQWQAPSGGGGIATYANAAALPAVASNYDLGITLDTGDLYTYSTNDNTWHLFLNLDLANSAIYDPSSGNIAISLNGRVLVDLANNPAFGFGSTGSIDIYKSLHTDGTPHDIGTNFARFGDIYVGQIYGDGVSSNNGELYLDCTNGSVSLSSQNEITKVVSYNGSVAPKFAWYDKDAAFYAAIKAPNTLTANYTLTLPVDDGNSGQVLSTDGAGTLSWATAAGLTSGFSTGLTNLMSDSWATDIPSLIADGNTAEALAAGAVGIVLDSEDYNSSLLIATRDSAAAGSSGIYMFTGTATAAGQSAGEIEIAGGNGDTGGDATLRAGTSSGATTKGGSVTLVAGNNNNAATTAKGGDVILAAGTASNGERGIIDANSAAWVIVPKAWDTNPAHAPAPVAGALRYDTGAAKLKVYNGTAWETVTSV